MTQNSTTGNVTRVAGTVVFATGFSDQSKNVMVRIGDDRILGEVVQVREETLVIQAYEETEGLKIGDIVENTREPFTAILGPGMLGKTFDGLQRPTMVLLQDQGPFLDRGTMKHPYDMTHIWYFTPTMKTGTEVSGGQAIGNVNEGQLQLPIIIDPKQPLAKITWIADSGEYRADTVLARLSDGSEVKFHHNWQIRTRRPYIDRKRTIQPLVTGQRIIDSLFPIAKGGTSIVSGGFGTGKTILEQSLAKFSLVDVVILVLIGERGNEVATVLGEFSELTDEDGNSLLDRTVVIANTSNMPVAAREASIYLGMTIGEYYRDMGFDVAILADSMSRWAEAVREISGRLEEMPAEEGYPAYMSKSLGEFFERAGNYLALGNWIGSITFIAAISPPGGDFTEPVTQAALRVTGAFWALSTELARSRHFPSINWTESFSQYGEFISRGIAEQFKHWGRIRQFVLSLLKMEEELQQTVRLLGRDNLSEAQRGMLDMTRFIKDAFLQQDAFDEIDQDCSLEKQYLMLQIIDLIHKWLQKSIVLGMTSSDFFGQSMIIRLKRMHETPEDHLTLLESEVYFLNQEVTGDG